VWRGHNARLFARPVGDGWLWEPEELDLDDTVAVPVLVQSISRDLVEMLNSLLRKPAWPGALH
jgi:hypothetical protein